MEHQASRPTVRHAIVSGHPVRSVVADNEPERQRTRSLADLEAALPSHEELGVAGSRLTAAATTPDFHPGRPTPVGVVVDIEGGLAPHFVGNDIGCGMRMIVLDGCMEDDLARPELEKHLRHVFFQGGRDISLRGRDRHAILRDGIPGLFESLRADRRGLLGKLDLDACWREAERNSDGGFFPSKGVDPDFLEYAAPDDGPRHDAILGTIGGGNHFVEVGVIERVVDGAFAAAAGVRAGSVAVVIHSGSLDFGQRIGTATKERLAARRRGRVIGCDDPVFERFANCHANAVNAAFVNRFLIGLAAAEALSRALGKELGHRLVYDAPHNAIWQDGSTFRHRKGACPARGQDVFAEPFRWLGEPVILPGSMGDGTWLLKGHGCAAGLQSSAHGAGRKLSRQEARKQARVPNSLRVVGPVDPLIARNRPDILKEIERRLNEEAPAAYRPIDDVVGPMEDAGLADRVARIRPTLTVKG